MWYFSDLKLKIIIMDVKGGDLKNIEQYIDIDNYKKCFHFASILGFYKIVKYILYETKFNVENEMYKCINYLFLNKKFDIIQLYVMNGFNYYEIKNKNKKKEYELFIGKRIRLINIVSKLVNYEYLMFEIIKYI